MKRFFIFLVLSLSVFSACKDKAETSLPAPVPQGIIVGAVLSLSGLDQGFGLSAKNGMEMALEEFNWSGGVKEKQIVLVFADDQGKKEGAAAAIAKILKDHNPVAILGASASSRSLVIAPILQRQGIPMVSHSSTHPKVTQTGDYIFRVCFIDPFQGGVMARFAYEKLKAGKVAILEDHLNEYSVGLADVFKEKFTALGGKVMSVQPYTAGEVDFRPQLKAAQEGTPDVIFVPGYYADAARIVKTARSMKLKALFLGGDGWDSDRIFALGGGALDGSYFSTHYSPEAARPKLKSFVSRYKQRFGAVPDGKAALGYDAAHVLFDALKRAKTVEASAIRDALAGTKDFDGVTGMITINSERNAEKPAAILRIEKGKAVFVQTATP